MADKVQFGLSNVHLAKRTNTGGTITYGAPVALPGAVDLSIDPTIAEARFYADNILYFGRDLLNGFEGELEIALVPENIKKDFLGYVEDSDGNLVETNMAGADFALLFEVQGDEHAGKMCLFNCSFGRPSRAHHTTEDGIDVTTSTLPFTCAGEGIEVDGENVQAFSKTAEYGDTNYSTFFTTAPTIPTISA